jgi:short-subunit dehydrogenase
MRENKSGLIINISSIFGKRGMPYETAYSASKFALAGFSEALRAELMTEGIDVSTIYPGAIETEIFETAKNETGLNLGTNLPKFPARALAQVIVRNARFPQAEVVMAADAMALNFFNQIAPGLVDLALGWSVPFVEGAKRAANQQSKDKQ